MLSLWHVCIVKLLINITNKIFGTQSDYEIEFKYYSNIFLLSSSHQEKFWEFQDVKLITCSRSVFETINLRTFAMRIMSFERWYRFETLLASLAQFFYIKRRKICKNYIYFWILNLIILWLNYLTFVRL